MTGKAAQDSVLYPFRGFSFAVEIQLPDVPGVQGKVCSAAFSECDGLEITREVKTLREGGNNGSQIRLAGALNFGQLTLKRGMSPTFDLWHWFEESLRNPALRADADVLLLSPEDSEGAKPLAQFRLTRCLPVKLRAPPLIARDGGVAIEEFGLAYESLHLQRSGG